MPNWGLVCQKQVSGQGQVNTSHKGFVCQKQVSRAGTNSYIAQYLWDVITCPCPWYLLLVQNSSTVQWWNLMSAAVTMCCYHLDRLTPNYVSMPTPISMENQPSSQPCSPPASPSWTVSFWIPSWKKDRKLSRGACCLPSGITSRPFFSTSWVYTKKPGTLVKYIMFCLVLDVNYSALDFRSRYSIVHPWGQHADSITH